MTLPPGTPTAVGADGQVTLHWSAPNGALSYNVYRGTTPGGEGATPIATGLSSTSLIDSGLTDGQTYYYWITAVDTGGESAHSAEVSATPLAPLTPPPAPSNIVPTAGDTQALLAWSAVPGATSYNIYFSTTGRGETLLQAGVTAANFTQSGLTNGQTYYYQISSVNALGEGSRSTEIAVTPQPLPPPTPINVTATPADGQVSLSWTAASDAQSYNVYRSTDSGDEVLYAQGVVGTSFVDDEVLDGVTYYYQVSAANGVGESNLSTEVSATPLPALPAAPTGLAAGGLSGTQIQLQWQDSSSQLTGFEIERSTDGVTFTPLTTVDPGVTSYVDAAGLAPGVTYYYQVVALNLAGGSGPSNTAQGAVLTQLPPPWTDADIGSPALAGSGWFSGGALTTSGSGADIWNASDQFNFAYQTLTGDGSIIARVTSQGNTDPWAKAGVMIRNTLDASSAFADLILSPGNGAAFQYRPTAGGTPTNDDVGGYAVPDWVELVRSGNTLTGYVSTDGINWTQVGSTTIAMNAQVFVGLAVTSHNAGSISTATFDDIAIDTATPQLPAAPGTPSLQALSGTSAQISWSDADSSPYAFNVLRQNSGGADFTTIATVPAGTTTYTDTGLTPGASYTYEIVAVSTVGNSAPSSPASLTLPVPPMTPSLLAFNQIGTSSTGLSWQLNSTNDTGVNVYRRDGSGSFVLVKTLPPGTMAYIDSGLQPGTIYEYRITASNSAGESAFADAGVTTLPSAPGGVVADAASGAITLHWSAAAGALAYNIYRGLSPSGEGATPYAAGIDLTSYTDLGVNDGTQYYYFVTSVDFSGESTASSEVSGVPQPVPQPVTTPSTLSVLAPGPAVVVDPGLTIVNASQITTITGATVSFATGFAAGEDQLAVGATDPNVTVSYDPTSGVLTLSGNDTPANYQALLASVTYQDTSLTPSPAGRSITFALSDSAGTGSAAHNVQVTVDQSPVVQTTSGPLQYVPVLGGQVVDSNLTVSDATSPMLTSGSVSIDNYASTGGSLSFTPGSGIAGSFDATTGVLSLSGTASIAAWQQVLRTVTYDNPGAAKQLTPQTISFVVSDGYLSSNTATRQFVIDPFPWQNPLLRWDVNNDGSVTPLDALAIINRLNKYGPGPLAVPAPDPVPEYYDVYGDNQLTPLDALNVINYLNAAALAQSGLAAAQSAASGATGSATVTSASAGDEVSTPARAPTATSNVASPATARSAGGTAGVAFALATLSGNLPAAASSSASASTVPSGLDRQAVAQVFQSLGAAAAPRTLRRGGPAAVDAIWDGEL